MSDVGLDASIDVHEEPIALLTEHARIPIRFRVERVYDVDARTKTLLERTLETPYQKDYDLDNPPARWPERFDVSSWGLIAARSGGRRVGGAVIAFGTPGLDMLEGRSDLAVLWDIRVQPELRGARVGTRLFAAAERWAAARGCAVLEIETQNINVPACRFYASRGCVLGSIHLHAYPELPEEAMLLWYKHLRPCREEQRR